MRLSFCENCNADLDPGEGRYSAVGLLCGDCFRRRKEWERRPFASRRPLLTRHELVFVVGVAIFASIFAALWIFGGSR